MSDTEQLGQADSGTKDGFMPLWEPGERVFAPMALSLIERKGTSRTEYHVYSDELTFETVQAETAIDALESSDIESPLKIEHAHCRMPPIIGQPQLAFQKLVQVAIEEDQEDNSDREARMAKAKEELASTLGNLLGGNDEDKKEAPGQDNTPAPEAEAAVATTEHTEKEAPKTEETAKES